MLRRFSWLTVVIIAAGLAACQGQPEPAPATEAPAAVQAQPTPAPTEAATATEALTETPAATEAPSAPQAAGLTCAFAGTGATVAIDAGRLNFDCGQDGDYTVGLFGDITNGDKGWEITQGDVKLGASAPESKNVGKVLVTHIILDDGTDCAWAGRGATTGIGDKRLNYTCGQDGDYTIGLFGDVTQGDKGWQITQGEVKVTTAGPVSQKVTTATIAKLVVEPE